MFELGSINYPKISLLCGLSQDHIAIILISASRMEVVEIPTNVLEEMLKKLGLLRLKYRTRDSGEAKLVASATFYPADSDSGEAAPPVDDHSNASLSDCPTCQLVPVVTV